jgi:hypothetical protein
MTWRHSEPIEKVFVPYCGNTSSDRFLGDVVLWGINEKKILLKLIPIAKVGFFKFSKGFLLFLSSI